MKTATLLRPTARFLELEQKIQRPSRRALCWLHWTLISRRLRDKARASVTKPMSPITWSYSHFSLSIVSSSIILQAHYQPITLGINSLLLQLLYYFLTQKNINCQEILLEHRAGRHNLKREAGRGLFLPVPLFFVCNNIDNIPIVIKCTIYKMYDIQ